MFRLGVLALLSGIAWAGTAEGKAALAGDYIAQHYVSTAYIELDRLAEAYAWAIVSSATENAWPAESKIMAKLYRSFAKSQKSWTKRVKQYMSREARREGKAMAKRYLKEIRAKLKARRPWEEPDI